MIQGSHSLFQKTRRMEHFLFSKAFRIGLLSVLIVAIFFHVVKMSEVSTKGYELSRLQSQMKSLEEEKQRLDIDIARMSSMEYIQEKVSQMAFVPIEKPSYIKVQSSLVAKR